jgi:uncharacterized membrane protein
MALGLFWQHFDLACRTPYSRHCVMRCLPAFALLRSLHTYGDPTVWTSSSGVATAIKGFLNVQEYPASLQYCAITLGISLLFLAWFDSLLTSGRALWLRISVEVYGRVPMAFYILHVYLIHTVALVLCALTGHDWHRLALPGRNETRPAPRIRVQPSGCISDLDDDRPFALLAHSAVCGLQTRTPGKAVAQLHISVPSE